MENLIIDLRDKDFWEKVTTLDNVDTMLQWLGNILESIGLDDYDINVEISLMGTSESLMIIDPVLDVTTNNELQVIYGYVDTGNLELKPVRFINVISEEDLAEDEIDLSENPIIMNIEDIEVLTFTFERS